MPTFWLALLLQILFVNIYLKLDARIVYTAGLDSVGAGAWTLDRLQHLARGLNLSGLLGCAIVTETIYSLDGLGFYFIQKLGSWICTP